MQLNDEAPLSALTAVFRHYTSFSHFFLQDLRNGEVWEFGERRSYPIGSCFKLAVLIAAFEGLTAREIDAPIRIEPTQFRIGVGVINMLDSAVCFSPLQLCQLMLTASDGTATDWLIRRLGLDAVNAVLQRYAPSSHVARDLGDMVEGFRSIPEAPDCKQRTWEHAELEEFTKRVAAMGSTDARDLASLAEAAWTFEPESQLHQFYQRCVGARTRLLPRTAMHSPSSFFTKTGSIGRTFFCNDSGIVLDASGQAIAKFGWCGAGWLTHAAVTEAIGGEIGLLILKLLGVKPTHQSDRTVFGTQMIQAPHISTS